MDDAVSDSIDLGKRIENTQFSVCQRAQHTPHNLLTGGKLNLFFSGESLRVLHRDGSDARAKLDRALPQASRRMIWESRTNFVERGLLAARTRVEHENLHGCGGRSYLYKSKCLPISGADWNRQVQLPPTLNRQPHGTALEHMAGEKL